MSRTLAEVLLTKRMSGEELLSARRRVYQATLNESSAIAEGNFRRISAHDLQRMFDLIDRTMLEGTLRPAVGKVPLSFRLSARMTSAGGLTTHHFQRRGKKYRTTSFDIAISTTLLFQTFQDVDRPVQVVGLRCRDRLEALQRVMEHEVTHLGEMVVWGESFCTKSRFQGIASRIFGHRDHRHQLITQSERALVKYKIRQGDRVSFQLEGRTLSGFVNRITRRATVLVEDPRGTPYQDGKRYAKYYVPLQLLQRAV